MKKRNNNKGFSTIEIFSIAGIAVMTLLILLMAVHWYRISTYKTEDRLIANNAEKVASLNASGGACIVRNCPGGENCTHQEADGSYVGYFDHPSNSIQAEKGKGYNEYKVMTIDDRKYYGDARTMVIRVKCKGDVITLDWVKGNNR